MSGIACRSCGCRDLRVKRTEPAAGDRIRRVRFCRNCGRQQVTYEANAGEQSADLQLSDLTPSQREGLVSQIMRALGIPAGGRRL